GVEGAADAHVEAVHAPVRHAHRLGEAFRLVVDAPGPDRVHVAPVGLVLGVDLRIAVDLAGRGQEVPGPLVPGQAEGVVGAEAARFERFDRQRQVGLRGCRAGQVHDRVDGAGDVDAAAHVPAHEAEPVPTGEVGDVGHGAGAEVV